MNIRKAITKMRVSSHKFPIETGRYEKRERCDRICPLCCNSVGDEQHYIFDCDNKGIENKRKQFISIIYNKLPEIEKLNKFEQYKYMLLCRDENINKDIGVLFLNIQKEFENIL